MFKKSLIIFAFIITFEFNQSKLLASGNYNFDDFGITQEKNLTFNGDINLPIEELSDAHKYWLKDYINN